jgi:hypothetical protein
VGSSADPTLNGHLKYPNNLDQSLNDAAADKIRKYRADYNNRPPSAVSFMPAIASTSGTLHSEFVRLLFLQSHRETDRFFVASGIQSAQSTSVFHFRRAAFLSGLKSKVGLALSKAAVLRVVLNLDGAPIASKSHTHPSHSQTSHLLTSSLSLGLPSIHNKQTSAVSFMPAIPSTSGRLHSEFVRILFLQVHRETDRFFTPSGVQLAQTTPGGQFTFRRAAFLTQLHSQVDLALPKAASLRININLDGLPIASKSHTHPSHSQTSRLLTSSLSLGVPVTRPTQCVRDA